ncbi:hypothetical protein LCGC14_1515100 [marine sediment metagenome]|uniref:Uncharacterized protein n=1 Tax=marine sediment metagenome TaxID=412755 RepID=A0A0F9JL06_9ZZZZ
MFNMKESKKIKAVNVHLFNDDGNKDHDVMIEIPEGGRIRITEIGSNILVYNKGGNLINRYNLQAGYTWNMEYIYKD